MLTNASKYAIRSVLFLAQNSSIDNKYGAKQIAKELDIPLHFIAKLLQPLVKKGIVSSLKGPKGGFYFTTKNGKNRVCDIITVIEGKNIFESCFLGLPKCGDENPCPVHHIVSPFKKDLLIKFEMSLNEFIKDMDNLGTILSLPEKK
jgi:Rrf2 family protein